MSLALESDIKFHLRNVFNEVLAKCPPSTINQKGHKPANGFGGIAGTVTSDHKTRNAVFVVDGESYDVLPSPVPYMGSTLVWADRQINEPRQRRRR